tara:strand:- start:67 stop:1206 length:1140 start_codon:yes stop_codon:yes gene_type:complete
MLFREIPGNEEVKNQLISTVKKNRIAHAQIFTGNKGCAKLALAIAYATYINCENKTNEDSCGKCMSCLKYATLSHPDLHLVFPIIKSKKFKNSVSDNFVVSWRKFILKNPYQSLNSWINDINLESKKGEEGFIYKDEALLINQKLTLKKFEAKYRVFIFWMPEKMNREASNKLLKIFEEPPGGTIFVLISENPNALLQTIKSRLQQINIKNFTHKDAVLFFKKENLSIEKIIELSKNTNSDFGKITALLEEEDVDFFKSFSLWMRLVYKTDIIKISSWVDTISVIGRKNQKLFLSYSIKMIRECLIFNFAEKSLLQTNKIEQDFVSKFAPFIHESNTIIIVEVLENAIKAINRNANAKIVLFDLSLQLIKFLKIKKSNN